jgi:hypothetical protein
MHKMHYFALGLVAAIGFGQPASAEVLDVSIKNCLAGQLSEEQKQSLLVTLSEVKFVFTEYARDNIAACFTEITGHASVFSPGQGLTSNSQQIEKATSEKNALAAQAETSAKERHDRKCALLTERDKLEALVQEANNLVDLAGSTIQLRTTEAQNETIKSCSQWYNDDKISAITNSVCNKIFIERGLPDSTVVGPTAEQISSAYSALAAHPKRLEEIAMALSQINDDDAFAKKRGEVALLQWKASKAPSTLHTAQKNSTNKQPASTLEDCP